MPSNVVKTERDEKKWEKAVELAEEAGHKGNYAYIMGIYKNMNPDHKFKASSLRRDLIKLAYARPDLRRHLLPMLKTATPTLESLVASALRDLGMSIVHQMEAKLQMYGQQAEVKGHYRNPKGHCAVDIVILEEDEDVRSGFVAKEFTLSYDGMSLLLKDETGGILKGISDRSPTNGVSALFASEILKHL
jgi:hypothetical protein